MLSVSNDGCGFPFMGKPVFDYLVKGSYDLSTIPSDQLPDTKIRTVSEQVSMEKTILKVHKKNLNK